MNTLNKIVYEIRNIYKLHADDSTLTNRLLAQYIKEARAKLLEEDISKGKIISDEFVQTLPCVEFERFQFEDACCDNPYEFEVCFMRSVRKLPATIQRNSKNSIVAVQAVDLSKDYSETTHIRAKYNKHNRFIKHSTRWFLKDGYMYLTNTNEIKHLSISGIFSDPEETISFTTCSGNVCFDWDSPYPMSAGMTKRVIDIVLQERLRISYVTVGDNVNDAKDEKTGQRENRED